MNIKLSGQRRGGGGAAITRQWEGGGSEGIHHSPYIIKDFQRNKESWSISVCNRISH